MTDAAHERFRELRVHSLADVSLRYESLLLEVATEVFTKSGAAASSLPIGDAADRAMDAAHCLITAWLRKTPATELNSSLRVYVEGVTKSGR